VTAESDRHLENVQATVLAIWSDAIERPIVDANAEFFDSGGDSLAATLMLTSVKETFGIEVTLATLFDHSTAYEFAHAIAQLLRAERKSPLGAEGYQLRVVAADASE
jgi:acyl carrier protein